MTYTRRASAYAGRYLGMAAVIFCQPATLSLPVDRRVVRLGLERRPCRHDGSLVQHGLVAPGFTGGDLRLGWLDPVGRQILQDQQRCAAVNDKTEPHAAIGPACVARITVGA